MGWTYSAEWPSPTAVREHLKDSLTRSGYAILDEATTKYGRVFYAVITKPDITPTMFVALINGGSKDPHFDGPAWGYKDMDESMGPYEADAPLRLLDKLGPPPSDDAKEWRERVRTFHAKRAAATAAVKVAKKGDRVWANGRPEPYTVSYVRKGSVIGYRHDGAGPFRIGPSHIDRFEATEASI